MTDQTEVAVDRAALRDVLRNVLDRPHASAVISALLESGVLLDAAAVRHEHGERIAKAIEPRSNGGISRGSVIRLGALDDAARLARELSPEPS